MFTHSHRRTLYVPSTSMDPVLLCYSAQILLLYEGLFKINIFFLKFLYISFRQDQSRTLPFNTVEDEDQK